MSLGFDLAETAEPVAMCDINPFARAVWAKHWPEVTQYDDIHAVTADTLAQDGIGRIDLLCGGIPCQPHSQAGKRKAGQDDRDLWPEFARLLGEINPRWAVVENVAGLLTSDSGRFFGGILADLAALGFNAEWHCFPASAIGAPHRRERVWLVAYTQRLESGERHQPDMQRRRAAETEQAGLGSGGNPLAYTDGFKYRESWTRAEHAGFTGPENGCWSGGACGVGSNPASQGLQGSLEADLQREGRREQRRGVARLRGSQTPSWAGGGWAMPHPVTTTAESRLHSVAHGFPFNASRLEACGNAIVPQAAQVIGEAIKDAEAHWREFGVMPEQIVRPEHLERVRGVA